MVEETEKPSTHAEMVKRRMELCATQIAEMSSRELVPSAGRDALQASLILELTASSPSPTVVELVTQPDLPATGTAIRVAINGELCSTLNARTTSIVLAAVSAHQTALQV